MDDGRRFRLSLTVVVVVPDLQLQLLNALLSPYYILLQRSLISFQRRQLLLESLGLGLLVGVVSLDFFINSMKFIS